MEGAFILSFFNFKKERKKKMKKRILAITMTVIMLLCLVSCAKPTETDAIWENALYTEDTELGEGAKTVKVEVKAGEKSVVFTIKTDEAILGDALIANGIIEGEEGPYGLYIKKVNGILADYDVDQHYWGFYQNGEYMLTGVDMTEFADGESYELVYTK